MPRQLRRPSRSRPTTVGDCSRTWECHAPMSSGTRSAGPSASSSPGMRRGLVHTLSLLEPALLIGENIPLYRSGLEQSVRRYQEAGATVAVDEFLESRWPGYRTELDQVLPGTFEQARGRRCDMLRVRPPGRPRLAVRRGSGARDHPTRARRPRRTKREPPSPLRRDVSAAARLVAEGRRVRPATTRRTSCRSRTRASWRTHSLPSSNGIRSWPTDASGVLDVRLPVL